MKKRIPFYEMGTLALGLLLSILSAAICMQIMGQFGIAPNTSLISAVLVMVVARIPLVVVSRFRNLERQNYVLSVASSAGFAAANCGFVAIATMFVLGQNGLVIPMAFGTLIGSFISVFVTGRIFDSRIFPAKGAWPLGVAVATSLEAGDKGGKKGFELLQGLAIGVVASIFGVPAAGVGIVFIANMFTMSALGVGMILRGHSIRLFGGFDIGQSNIAQGVMIGAGIVALVQIFLAITKGSKNTTCDEFSVNDRMALKTMLGAVGLFIVGAIVIALVTGIWGEMGVGLASLWVVFASICAIISMVLVGTASMHSGWAPTFAVVTICLTVGVFIGFPPMPLAVLVGYIGSVGPCFADTGIGLKAGWLLRGSGTSLQHELYGRKQQVLIKQLGVVIGIAMAVFFGTTLVRSDVLPPMSIFYAYTVETVMDSVVLQELFLWAIPGAVLQAAFGSKSVGLMLAAGLLINNAVFGIAVLSAIVLRLVIGTKHMTVRAPGLIAGDGLFGFVNNIFRVFLGNVV